MRGGEDFESIYIKKKSCGAAHVGKASRIDRKEVIRLRSS